MGTVTAGNVTFVTGRELLDDMARDLARTIIAPLQASVEIHIGMHLPRRLKPSIPPGRRDILIGMQTEQVLDENGRELWNHRYRDKILSLVDRYDYIIDVSPTNAPIYNALPEGQRAKVLIGPYIFPVRAPALAISEEAPLVFIGSLNNRRERALAWMEKNGAKIRRVPEGTFGEDLAAEVDAAGGIVNIHFDKGIYNEYPRLLKAVLAGKPLISEGLAPPMVEGQHYLGLEESCADAKTLSRIYDQMVALLCGTFALQDLLNRLTANHPRPQP